MIAFLFAQVVNNWWLVPFVFHSENIGDKLWYTFTAQLLFSWFIFIIHLVFLAGMYQLRRFIYKNTIDSWYQQFDQKP